MALVAVGSPGTDLSIQGMDGSALCDHPVHQVFVKAPDQEGLSVGGRRGHERGNQAGRSSSSKHTVTLCKYGVGAVTGSGNGSSGPCRAATDDQDIAIETPFHRESDPGIIAGRKQHQKGRESGKNHRLHINR